MSSDSTLPAVGTGFAVIILCCIPSLSALVAQLSTREPRRDIYEDADGKATPESMKAYTAKLPKTFVLLFAAIGCSLSLAIAVPSVHRDWILKNWLSATAWVRFHFTRGALPSSRVILP
jgi:hypothetical protein